MRVKLPDWAEDLWTPARYYGIYGGRGSAKSHSVATYLPIVAAQEPVRILCGREIQKSIKDSVKRLLDDKINEMGMRDRFVSTDTAIKGVNGSSFIFAGFRTNPDTIKSLEGIDIAWIEEANTVSVNSIEVLIPTIRKPRSRLIFTWNPKKKNDPVDKMFRGDKPPPDSIIRRVNYWDNPFFPEVLKLEMEWDRKRDPAKYRHIWEGEYQSQAEALVFNNWTVDDFITPAGVRLFYGGDWGYARDPSVLIRCWIDKEKRRLYFDYEAYQIGCEIENLPKLFDQVPEARAWPLVADSARPETISYMKRHGYKNIRAAKKGKGSVEDGIEFMKNYDIVVHPRCKHLIDELSFYSWMMDPLTGEILPILEDKNNHVIDAARYAVEATRKALYRMLEVA